MKTIYQYKCPQCGAIAEEYRHVDHRDDPAYCYHKKTMRVGKNEVVDLDMVTMKRVFTVPLFTANRAQDRIENKIYHGDREDVRRQQKADDIAYEKATAHWDLSPPKTKTMDDILSSGIIQAAKTKEGLMQWRRDNIPADAEPVNA